jgi:hypothetical protein
VLKRGAGLRVVVVTVMGRNIVGATGGRDSFAAGDLAGDDGVMVTQVVLMAVTETLGMAIPKTTTTMISVFWEQKGGSRISVRPWCLWLGGNLEAGRRGTKDND